MNENLVQENFNRCSADSSPSNIAKPPPFRPLIHFFKHRFVFFVVFFFPLSRDQPPDSVVAKLCENSLSGFQPAFAARRAHGVLPEAAVHAAGWLLPSELTPLLVVVYRSLTACVLCF